jgi:hypothetical protein
VQVGGRFVDKAELKDGDLLVLGEIRIEYHDGTTRRSGASGSGSAKSAYPETLYDTVEEDSSPRRADTLVDAEELRGQADRGNASRQRGPSAPGRPSREDESSPQESDASRSAEDDSFRKAEDDSFRGNGGQPSGGGDSLRSSICLCHGVGIRADRAARQASWNLRAPGTQPETTSFTRSAGFTDSPRPGRDGPCPTGTRAARPSEACRFNRCPLPPQPPYRKAH